MPLHNLLFDYLLPRNAIDNLWRDIILIILLITIYLSKQKYSFDKYSIILSISFFVGLIYLLFSANKFIAMNALRIYYMPASIYFIASMIDLDDRFRRNIEIIIIKTGVFISAFALIQAFIFGDKILILLGYPSSNGHLYSSSFYIAGHYGLQRAVATFSSPNIFGTYISIVLLVSLFSANVFKFKIIDQFILFSGLIGSVSRSAILGLTISLFIYLIIFRKQQFFKDLLKYALIFIIFSVSLLSVDGLIFQGKISTLVSSSIYNTATLSDPSAQKHLEEIGILSTEDASLNDNNEHLIDATIDNQTTIRNSQPFEIIIKNPMGLGLGQNGPIAYEKNIHSNMVESSYYLIFYEIGIFGGLLFLLPYIFIIIDSIKKKNQSQVIPFLISITLLFVYIFLPNVQTYELPFIFFLFLGIVNNIQQKNQNYHNKLPPISS